MSHNDDVRALDTPGSAGASDREWVDFSLEKALPALEVDRRLMALAHASRRVDAALCFYLLEVDARQLYLEYGFASTADYARERFGFERRKSQTLVSMARRLKTLPRIEARFRAGELAWTKVREIVKVATESTEGEWLARADSLSSRQLEQAVRAELPPVRRIILNEVLVGDRAETWLQAKEALDRMAGKNLSNLEALDLMFAEVLCAYAATPPLGPPEEKTAGTEDGGAGTGAKKGGYAALVIERDGFQCTRPGCSNRTCLTANHITRRSQGGRDHPSNLHTVCLPCHQSIERGQLSVQGIAPDGLTWEGAFGPIEKPLPLTASEVEDRLRGAAPPPDGTRVELPESPPESPRPDNLEEAPKARRPNGLEMAAAVLGPPSETPYDLPDDFTTSGPSEVRDRECDHVIAGWDDPYRWRAWIPIARADHNPGPLKRNRSG